ncbi:MAG: hypothetical protein EBR82_27880 [Caulobacteraceae bacterium]|nr:hypothetical protein [Caulobacteraceae bacterium]
MAAIWFDADVGNLMAGTVNVSAVVDASQRLLAAGATKTLTAADDGKVILLDTAAGSVVTLPASSGSGVRYRFVISTKATSNSHKVQVANASDIMQGVVLTLSDNSAAVLGYAAGSSDDTITLNRTTTGSTQVGEYIDVIDIATNVWAVSGVTASTGAEGTPFSAAVS